MQQGELDRQVEETLLRANRNARHFFRGSLAGKGRRLASLELPYDVYAFVAVRVAYTGGFLIEMSGITGIQEGQFKATCHGVPVKQVSTDRKPAFVSEDGTRFEFELDQTRSST